MDSFTAIDANQIQLLRIHPTEIDIHMYYYSNITSYSIILFN